jgi:hypothetical protein
MVDTLALLLAHNPPPVASVKAVVAAGQTLNVPVIAAGEGLTDAVTVTKQPEGSNV